MGKKLKTPLNKIYSYKCFIVYISSYICDYWMGNYDTIVVNNSDKNCKENSIDKIKKY